MKTREVTYTTVDPEWLREGIRLAIETTIKNRGVTHEELARRIGKARTNVTMILSGHGGVTITVLYNIDLALDVPVSDLLP